MARPTITNPSSIFPSWATSGTGIANTVYPGATKQGDGWAVDEQPPASWWNWWWNSVGQWLSYSSQVAAAALWDHRKQSTQVAQALSSNFRLRTYTFPSGAPRFGGVCGGGNGTSSRVLSSYIVSDDTGANPPLIKFNNASAGTFPGLPGTPSDYAIWASAQRLGASGEHIAGIILSDGTAPNTLLYEVAPDKTLTNLTPFGANYNLASDGTEPFLLSQAGASSNIAWATLTDSRLIIIDGMTPNLQAHGLGGQPVAGFYRKGAGVVRTILAMKQDGSVWRQTHISAPTFNQVITPSGGTYVAADSGIQAMSCDGVAAWCVVRRTASATYDVQYSHDDGVTWASVTLSILGASGQHPTMHAIGLGSFALIADDTVFMIYTEAPDAVFSSTNGHIIPVDKLDAEPINVRSSFGFLSGWTGTGPMAGGIGKFPES